jgi:hypothetical protein
MPALNRKGPNGNVAMSGRGMGLCNPENKGKTAEQVLQERLEAKTNSEITERGNARGVGKGQGRGFGGGKGCGLGNGRGKGNRYGANT